MGIYSISPLPGDDLFTGDVIRWCQWIAWRWRSLPLDDAISYAMESVWEVHGEGAENLLQFAHKRMISKAHNYHRKANAKRRTAKLEALDVNVVEATGYSPEARAILHEEYQLLVGKHGKCPACNVPLVKRVQAGMCEACYARSRKKRS